MLDEALGPLGEGGLVIETSTIGPADARAAHALAAERGAGYVDAAILSGVEQVRDGTSAFLVGGEPGDVARAEPVLRRVCERVFRFGGPGTGMAAKVVNNAVAHAEMVILVEAAALAAAEGIALDDLCELLEQDDAGVKRPLSGRLAGRVARAATTTAACRPRRRARTRRSHSTWRAPAACRCSPCRRPTPCTSSRSAPASAARTTPRSPRSGRPP